MVRPTSHPCGSLPVKGFSMHVWWCPTHQAFWANAYSYLETGESETPQVYDQDGIQFGPFDTLRDVEAWLQPKWTAWHTEP